jgi:hypothetical protein
MYARITGLVVLASLVALPFLNGQEPARPTSTQLRTLREASAARAAARQQATVQVPSLTGGPLVTLDILLIDHNSDAGGAAPTAAELVKRYEAGELDRVVRVQLSNVAETLAYTQLGESVPQATARAGRGGFDARGEAGVTYSYTYQDIGTLVRANTRVEDAGTVLVDLQFERSSMAPHLQPSDESDDLIGRQKTVRRARQSTLRLKPGEPAIAEAWQSRSGDQTTGQFLVVTAHVQPGGDRPAAGEARTRIFMLRTAKADAMQRVLAEVYGDSKPIRTSVDSNRNALIISAPREELEEVEQLIQALDAGEK